MFTDNGAKPSKVIMADQAEKADKYNIHAVERSFQILDLFVQAEEPLTVQIICKELDINSNMAFRMLTTMVKAGYLNKDEKNGSYSVSLKMLQLSRRALMSLDIRHVVMPYLDMLRQKYPRANLNLAVLYLGDVIVVDRVDSQNLPRTYFAPGKSLPFHATGLGKILTCELPEKDLDDLIEKKGLKPYTPNTITSPEALKAELSKIRQNHVSRDRAEFIPQDNCNAVPLRDASGAIIAAISITAFESYMTVDEIEQTIPVLSETARNISYYLGFNA
jgi:DNA-binding IclR family transcriptional regulator